MLAITINLDTLKSLIVEFIRERGDDDNQLVRQLLMSDFMLWLQEKQYVEKATSGINRIKTDRFIN